MQKPTADENLLLGVLALQMDFISREQLIAATSVWMQDKSKSLSQVLLDQGVIDAECCEMLEKMARKHVSMHGNDPEKSLAAVGPLGALHDDLRRFGDVEIDATLDHISGAEGKIGAVRDAPERLGKGDIEATSDHISDERRDDIDHTQTFQSGTEDDGPPSTMTYLPDVPHSANLRFRILRPHAKGGLGVVSLAMDEELRRKVAFKELREHCADDPGSRSRFVLEAETTGRLEHPGVVPIYGLGTRADGRPFYAMRFVRGESLRKAIDKFHAEGDAGLSAGQRAIGLRKLLRRFVDVCNTIQYAHSRGVIHRDLKPDNVMLGKYGETLVVDWGTAKWLDRPDLPTNAGETTVHPISGSGSVPTQMGSVIGTPMFMSPEQAEGRPDLIGPASDVYSLGATLYSLLTNAKPFTSKSILDVLEDVRKGNLRRPREIDPRVPKALEAVCLKAMALKPEDRYDDAAALAEDVEHWLADEPVTAHQDTLAERTGRWMRRHRTLVQVGIAALLLVCLVSIVATVLVNKARQRADALANSNQILAQKERDARREGLLRFRKARDSVDTWLTGTSEAMKYYPGVQEVREYLLAEAAKDYEWFAEQISIDVGQETERGRAYLRLGDVHRELGKTGAAEDAYRSAMTLLEGLASSHPEIPDCQLELANSLIRLGLLLAETGRPQEAENRYVDAADKLQRLAETHPDDQRFRDTWAESMINRAAILYNSQRRQEAIDLLQQAIGETERLRTIDPREKSYLVNLATAQSMLTRIFVEEGQTDKATNEMEKAAQTHDLLMETDPNNPEYLLARACGRIDLGTVLGEMGKYGEELNAYKDAIVDFQTLNDVLPGISVYREELARAWMDLGNLLYELGRNVEAESELNQALPVLVLLANDQPDVFRYYEELAACRDTLGQVLSDLGRNQEAKLQQEEAVSTFAQLVERFPNEPRYRESWAVGRAHLGQALDKIGLHEEAVAHFREAIDIIKNLAQFDPSVPRYRNELAFVNSHLGNLYRETAIPLERRTPLVGRKKTGGPCPESLPRRYNRHHRNIFTILRSFSQIVPTLNSANLQRRFSSHGKHSTWCRRMHYIEAVWGWPIIVPVIGKRPGTL